MDESDRQKEKLARPSGGAIANARCAVAILSEEFVSTPTCLQELALTYVMDTPLLATSIVP